MKNIKEYLILYLLILLKESVDEYNIIEKVNSKIVKSGARGLVIKGKNNHDENIKNKKQFVLFTLFFILHIPILVIPLNQN